MTREITADDLELLTQGSVWPKNDGTAPVSVLFVTNTTLSAKALRHFPSQVVYADEEGNVFNRSIADFLGMRKFHNIDPELEQRLGNLLQFNAQNIPELDLEDNDAEASEADVKDAEGANALMETLAETSYRIGFYQTDDEGLAAPVLSAEELVAASTGYRTEPLIDANQTLHRFDFRIGGNVTLETVEASFHHLICEAEKRRFYAAFGIAAAGQTRTIEWNTFVGVFPHYTTNGLFVTLMLATDGLAATQAEMQALTDTPLAPATDTLPSETEQPVQVTGIAIADIDPTVAAQLAQMNTEHAPTDGNMSQALSTIQHVTQAEDVNMQQASTVPVTLTTMVTPEQAAAIQNGAINASSMAAQVLDHASTVGVTAQQ